MLIINSCISLGQNQALFSKGNDKKVHFSCDSVRGKSENLEFSGFFLFAIFYVILSMENYNFGLTHKTMSDLEDKE